ncbi:30S ribosomal subunit protein S19 [Candidatus Nasuia deltocephalinicola]|uniref:Small ribosomal subunit protein uS19 n=1 Tax=Candidatus Nasuia deltocephalincola TaxID=1160784 RepID=A0A974WPI8_9PROT|nr:30S ribosomal protein S19 [Candidatus Nasuia deltocephalinicola]BEH03946.1 30S ribosomal subunit protein S19 [Candidatus Nasuia deltocephalinicola]
MSRSLKKGFYFNCKIFKKVNIILSLNLKKVIKTWSRNTTILSNYLNFTFLVHNGKKFIPVFVTKKMFGHKLGEFSFTRTFKGHSLKK